ncbi:LCP family glycopolymer transferase [Brevibacillus laterosporus]
MNTDVNIVVVLSPKDKKITMGSIPRDTKVGCNLISQRLYIEK